MIEDAGVIPFYSEMKVLDMGGLNDEYIAHNKLSLTDSVQYIKKHNPVAIAITNFKNTPPITRKKVRDVMESPPLGNYSLYKIYSTRAGSIFSTSHPYYQFLYIRKDKFLNLK